MYSKLPNLVIGFHGRDKEVYEKVIINGEQLKASENTYDWLGHGIYFWEQNLERAEEWAKRRHKENAAVIGAVIDLGLCLNLTDSVSSGYLKNGFKVFKAICQIAGVEIPVNRPSQKTEDILLRDLDCAVIQQIQQIYSTDPKQPAFDSVRGVFIECKPAFEGSEIREKTHIQICVCNPNCIKGYFAPRKLDAKFRMP